jgi:type II secretory pathway pseudopilin PulG
MKSKKNVLGFSLIEVTIVLALSLVLVGMVAGIYNLRKGLETDDALKQISSVIQTVRNDAQKGLGPTSQTETDRISLKSNSELFGQAIGFGNNCIDIPSDPSVPVNPNDRTGRSCMYVIKLARVMGTSEIYAYGGYKIDVPNNMAFNLINSGDACNTFLSCYAKPNTGLYSNLGTAPISSTVSGDPVGIVILNGSGAMYAFNGNLSTLSLAADINNYTGQQGLDRQGILRLVVAQLADKSDSDLQNRSVWESAEPRYFLSVDLTGRNSTIVKRGNQFK